MDAAILVSIVIRVVTVVRSLFLWKRLRDWRLGVLTTLLFLMMLRQLLTLLEHAASELREPQGWSLVELSHGTELPALAVSVLALLGLVQLERWLTGLSSAQQALRRTERSLSEAQRIASLGNWDLDVAKNELWWSDEVYRMFGLPPQEFEVTYEAFLARVHPDDRERMNAAQNAALTNERPLEIDHRIVLPDGTERIVHEKGEVFFGADGKPVRLVGTVHDITDRKRVEDSLRESEEKYRTLFEHSPAGIGITDAEGRILAMNDAMLEAGGYTREDLVHEPNVTEFYHDSTDRVRIFAELEKHGVVRQREVRMKRKDGTPYFVSLSVVPTLLDRESTFLAIAEDVTDRKEVEEAYRASTELQRLVLSQIDEIVFSATFPPGQFFAGELDFVSPKLESILGYTPEDFRNDPDLWLRGVHPDDMAGLKRTTEEILKSRTAGSREYRYRHKQTGAYRWIEDQVVPRLDSHGQVIGLFGASRDITRRKQAEEELSRSREILRRLAIREQTVREEERTSIAREIHDQLGQAMTALRMELSWLHRKLPDGSSAVSQRTQSMLSMIDDATATVRDLSSRLRPAALDDLGLPAAVEWQVREFGSRTDVQCAVEVPPTGLDIDADRATGLFRILQETLTNVARHAEASEVDVRLRVDGEDLVLRVHDNGKGIPESEVSSSESFGLLGMRERAVALHGSVTIEPSSDGGTTVTARVPM